MKFIISFFLFLLCFHAQAQDTMAFTRQEVIYGRKDGLAMATGYDRSASAVRIIETKMEALKLSFVLKVKPGAAHRWNDYWKMRKNLLNGLTNILR